MREELSMSVEHGGQGFGVRTAWLAGDVLSKALRGSLRELNARFLGLLKRMPEEELGYLGFAPTVTRLLRACETEATLIMAACPYALFDAAFRHHEYWRMVCGAPAAHDLPREAMPAAFDSAEYLADYEALTEMALFFAWHLATTNALATRLVLGMSPATTELIRLSTLSTIAGALRTRHRLLRPRWPQRTLFWRRLLAITEQSSQEEATTAQLIGIQLMATEDCLEQMPAAPAAGKR
jgi:hypothetical protein